MHVAVRRERDEYVEVVVGFDGGHVLARRREDDWVEAPEFYAREDNVEPSGKSGAEKL